jgi:hypothetical protein
MHNDALHSIGLNGTLSPPCEAEGRRRLAEAQRLFRHALASWAADALTLRRSGLDEMTWTRACDQPPLLRKAA